MGQVLSEASCHGKFMSAVNSAVPAAALFPPGTATEANKRVLICALDYKLTKNPLSCTLDAANMEKLCAACGIDDVTVMKDQECLKGNVEDQIREILGRCEEGDFFIFYYSGHGISFDDKDGDEEDGKDEAFGFVNESGQITYSSCMMDDAFADILLDATPPGVRILILTDCCHSGTIADLDKEGFEEIEAVAISGCLDAQTSGDTGKGGIMTHSMLLALDKILTEDADEEYSVGLVYNATLAYDDRVFNSEQMIHIQCTAATSPENFAWPLLPARDSGYQAPMHQALSAWGGSISSLTKDKKKTRGMQHTQAATKTNEAAKLMAQQSPEWLIQQGVDPALAARVAAYGLKANVPSLQALKKKGKRAF